MRTIAQIFLRSIFSTFYTKLKLKRNGREKSSFKYRLRNIFQHIQNTVVKLHSVYKVFELFCAPCA